VRRADQDHGSLPLDISVNLAPHSVGHALFSLVLRWLVIALLSLAIVSCAQPETILVRTVTKSGGQRAGPTVFAG